jgi:small subunit ribosomal protein S9
MRKANDSSIATKKNIDEEISNQINSSLDKINKDSVSKDKPLFYFGIGKRKKARAIAKLVDGSGKITVNGKPVHRYFNHPSLRAKCIYPLSITNLSSLYDVDIKTYGGGVNGQLDAIIPAIAKAIITIDDKYRPVLAQSNYK